MAEVPDTSRIDPAILAGDFVQQPAPKPLRVCCYGSSSSATPAAYLTAARSLGYLLAKRGHTCVNGAGAFGCMAAMNEGACAGNGHIVGVIHEMWLPRGDESQLRDGGAHPVFASTENAAVAEAVAKDSSIRQQGGPVSKGPKREMLVARGKDLQERKRLLVDKADALVVLPGGPGTWDELWEMACARGIGLTNIPIVCVNCDGFYEPFREILARAYNDKLTKLQPHEIVHFEPTAESAVRWIESVHAGVLPKGTASLSLYSVLRKSSFMHSPVLGRSDSLLTRRKDFSNVSKWVEEQPIWIRNSLMFAAGLTVGAAIASGRWQISRR
jgi:uncharacterized protein (TIGR00730 family)